MELNRYPENYFADVLDSLRESILPRTVCNTLQCITYS